MCWAIALAMIGSTLKWGLPSACTSPAARVTLAGTFIKRIPCEACTRPGLPISSLELRAFCKSGGSQPSSSSAPPSINTSALRSETTKLGRASTKCGSSVGFASTARSILSPPISRANEPKSGRVATTLSFACAIGARSRNGKLIEHRISFLVSEIIFVLIGVYSRLKLMGAVGAKNELELKKNRVNVAAGQEKSVLQKIVIVLQADFGELGWIPGQICA